MLLLKILSHYLADSKRFSAQTQWYDKCRDRNIAWYSTVITQRVKKIDHARVFLISSAKNKQNTWWFHQKWQKEMYSISLFTSHWVAQIKIRIRHYCHPITVAGEKNRIIQCRWGCEKTGTLICSNTLESGLTLLIKFKMFFS